jgi:hypothetical protein
MFMRMGVRTLDLPPFIGQQMHHCMSVGAGDLAAKERVRELMACAYTEAGLCSLGCEIALR